MALFAFMVILTADIRPLAVLILLGFVLLIDKVIRVGRYLEKLTISKTVKITKQHSKLREMINQQNDLIKRRTEWQVKQSKAAELNLYKQLESRDLLRNELTVEQFSVVGKLRSWSISPDTALLLYQIVDGKSNLNIAEAGSGVSTLVFGAALKNKSIKGHIYSLEHEVDYAEKTRQKLKDGGVSKLVTVIDAPIEKVKVGKKSFLWFGGSAINKIPDGSIDILFVDSPPGGMQPQSRYPALPLLYKKLSISAIVVLDDYNRPDEKEIINKWVKEFPEFSLEVVQSDHGTAILRRSN